MMMHRSVIGSIDWDIVDEIWRGEFLFTNKHMTYSGNTLEELRANFEKAVDKYLDEE